jgi:hypothetical protein
MASLFDQIYLRNCCIYICTRASMAELPLELYRRSISGRNTLKIESMNSREQFLNTEFYFQLKDYVEISVQNTVDEPEIISIR